jgi:hypothetical protein
MRIVRVLLAPHCEIGIIVRVHQADRRVVHALRIAKKTPHEDLLVRRCEPPGIRTLNLMITCHTCFRKPLASCGLDYLITLSV